MSDKQPIDYARADADVVRKKFRRRVVMFVIVTVVVMAIGGGWVHSSIGRNWEIGDFYRGPSIGSMHGSLVLTGSKRTRLLTGTAPTLFFRSMGIEEVGIRLTQYNVVGLPKWAMHLRYRTLFILAMIPWIITLIRLLRVWRVKHAVQIDQ